MASALRVACAAFVVGLAGLAAGCSGGRSRPASEATSPARRLRIKGSDTMVILARRWAERYMQDHPGVLVQVSGGGSGTGFAALVNGTTDIATASRRIHPREVEALAEERGVQALETRVALDAVAVYVHRDNPLRSLSLLQLRDIYRGRLPSWRQVGGSSARFVLYSRENNSGTYAFFKERVLGQLDFAPEVQTLPGTASVISAVARDRGGIGYGGISYSEGVRAVALREEGRTVLPTLEAATTGRYPLSRFLYMYSVGDGDAVSQRFLAWARSSGQALVAEAGYYPLPQRLLDEEQSPSPVPRAGRVPANGSRPSHGGKLGISEVEVTSAGVGHAGVDEGAGEHARESDEHPPGGRAAPAGPEVEPADER